MNVDTAYYVRNNPDVALSGRDPIEHYLEIGWKEGRDPSEHFSTTGYLAANPDVAAAAINPLQHFLTSGLAEGRTGWRKGIAAEKSPHGTVWGLNREYYLKNNPDVALSGRDPIEHYLEIGWKEGRDPSEYFSTTGYLAANPDVAAAAINPLQHFLTSGIAEGRTGWQKPLVDGCDALAMREVSEVPDQGMAAQPRIPGQRVDEAGLEAPLVGAPIPLTPRALRIFDRVMRIARSQLLG